jgi:hypothetical protein
MGKVRSEHTWCISMCRWRDVQQEEDTLSGKGKVRAHMVEFHVQVVRSTAGRGYIIWERLGQSTRGGVPCTGGEMYGMRRIHSLGKVRSEHTWWSSMCRWRDVQQEEDTLSGKG